MKEKERLAYIDPEKSLQEKELGNAAFKKGQLLSFIYANVSI